MISIEFHVITWNRTKTSILPLESSFRDDENHVLKIYLYQQLHWSVLNQCRSNVGLGASYN
jgi:hypothetical protein